MVAGAEGGDPIGTVGRQQVVEGAAAAAFAGYENDFLLLRPDRYVAAAVPRGSPEAIAKTVDDLFGATWQKGA
jgi:hypothetical protein